MENPEVNPHMCSHMVLNEGAEHTRGKGRSPRQTVLGELRIHMQKNETGRLFYTAKSQLGI